MSENVANVLIAIAIASGLGALICMGIAAGSGIQRTAVCQKLYDAGEVNAVKLICKGVAVEVVR